MMRKLGHLSAPYPQWRKRCETQHSSFLQISSNLLRKETQATTLSFPFDIVPEPLSKSSDGKINLFPSDLSSGLDRRHGLCRSRS
jgi:hypothetical protein